MRNSSFILVLLAMYAHADGIPPNPLVYSGVMLGPNGAPITTQQLVTLTLWRSETGSASGDQLCNPPSSQVTPDVLGRFTAAVDSVCVDKVRTTPEVWLEVKIGVSVVRPRTRLNAVPFAVEADRTLRHTVTRDGGTISVGGVFCGLAGPTSGTITAPGGLTGYRAAKVLCEAAPGCTRTAHMCTTDEVIRTTALGVSLPESGFYARGAMALHSQAQAIWTNDCNGYTDAVNSVASVWSPVGFAGNADCASMAKILCCD